MADQVAKRDVNRIVALLATGNDADADVLRILLDPTTKRLLVDALTEMTGHAAVGEGTKTITTTGTAVQLPNNACKRVFVQAKSDNSGIVVIGGSAVVAAVGTRKGLALYKTQGQWFYVDNTNLLYADSTSSGDVVHFFFED